MQKWLAKGWVWGFFKTKANFKRDRRLLFVDFWLRKIIVSIPEKLLNKNNLQTKFQISCYLTPSVPVSKYFENTAERQTDYIKL